MIFVGDDWSEDHHDVCLMDQAGKRLASRRLPEGLTGIRQLHELIAEHAEEPDQVVIGIETDRGLWAGAPAALLAFEDLAHGDALGVLGRAPTPEQGAHLDLPAIQSALKRGGRKRNIAARAREIRAALRSEQLAAPAPVAAAFGATTRAAVGIIAELNRQIADLETSLAEHFETHPDADIYRSLPGLGVVLGARVLGEFGDDPNRYTDAKSRRNYAGTSPLTVASGKKRAVLARHVRNRRLYDAIDQ